MDFEDRFPGFESWFCLSMAGKPWANYFSRPQFLHVQNGGENNTLTLKGLL